MHVDYVLDIEELPEECIADCASSGDVSEAVSFWREKLDFTVNRKRAVTCLAGYGAWDDEELAAMSDEDIAERVLWLACGDFKEFTYDQGRTCGSEIFCLE